MNQRTPNTQIEQLAMQALLPGLSFSMQRHLDLINEARQTVGLSYRGVPSLDDVKEAERLIRKRKQDRLAKANGRAAKKKGIHEADKSQRPWTANEKARIGKASSQRWRLIKEAGLMGEVNGSPSRELMEKAKRILAEREAA